MVRLTTGTEGRNRKIPSISSSLFTVPYQNIQYVCSGCQKLRLQLTKTVKMVRLNTGTEGRNRKSPFHFLVPIYCPLSKYIACLLGMSKIAASINKNSQNGAFDHWHRRSKQEKPLPFPRPYLLSPLKIYSMFAWDVKNCGKN